MRKLNITMMLLLSLALAALVNAHTNNDHEIYMVIDYAADVFETELWSVSAAELPERTTATWSSQSMVGLAYFDYMHFDRNYDEQILNNYFSDGWLSVILGNYDSWTEVDRCFYGMMRFYEFDAMELGVPYKFLQWVIPETKTRVMAFSLALPAVEEEAINRYREALAPDLHVCNDM